jgi:hypothetical protein
MKAEEIQRVAAYLQRELELRMQQLSAAAFTDNRFTITPKDGESFSDTMQRAAQAGKTVTPAEITSQGLKGLIETPAVLAAAPAIGVAQPAMASLGDLLGPAAGATSKAISAIKAMAEAHPYAAKLISKALEGSAATAGGAATYRWIKGLLPD